MKNKQENLENIRKAIDEFTEYLDDLFSDMENDKNKKIISDPGDEDENVEKDKAPD